MRLGIGLDPRLGGGHDFVSGTDELVDQAGVLGLLRVEPGALGQHVDERILDTEHPDGARHPAAAGQQAQGRLRQSDLAALDVGGDPPVTGQCDLQAAAEGRAVDGRDHRHPESLQPAQVPLDVLDGGECLTGILRGDRNDALEVTTGEEGLLARGDHHTGDRILLGDQTFDSLVH